MDDWNFEPEGGRELDWHPAIGIGVALFFMGFCYLVWRV